MSKPTKYDVIIPARNEDKTIGAIVREFKSHPDIREVFVIVDADTADNTADIALGQRAVVVYGVRGKGQNVKIGLQHVKTDNIILCDSDLRYLDLGHIEILVSTEHEFVIGVPDFPLTEIMISPKMTWQWFPRVFEAYKWVSGIRKVDRRVINRVDLHGYLNEVQINRAYERIGIQPEFRHLRGVYSPFRMTDKRMEEMLRDRKWGEEHGVFDR